MSGLVTAIPVGIAAFTATNLDDLVILTLLFSQVNATFRRRHIVIGQYVGFGTLVIASLSGFFGSLVLPQQLIGLLGLVPIAMGLNRLLNLEKDSAEEVKEEIGEAEPFPIASLLSPQSYSVAAITVANGSDNLSIYVPLFANSSSERLLLIIGVFFLLIGVWCYITDQLSRQPLVADILTRYGSTLVPFVLIGLGVSIVLESHSLPPLTLVLSCLCLMAVMGLLRMNGQAIEVEQK